MSAIVLTTEQLIESDRLFLRQLKIATREQLRAQLAVMERLAPTGGPFSWKRAAIERKLGVSRHEFLWYMEE